MKIEGIKWVTIIQGYSLDQYKYCIELIEEELETELIGVGSLATRTKTEDIYSILNLVRKHFDKIHGFGVNLHYLKDIRIFNLLQSCDTGAWRWNHNHKEKSNNHKTRYMATTHREKLENLKLYKEKISLLFNMFKPQMQIELFISPEIKKTLLWVFSYFSYLSYFGENSYYSKFTDLSELSIILFFSVKSLTFCEEFNKCYAFSELN